jgi:membrane associated rhomboid family serine protease
MLPLRDHLPTRRPPIVNYLLITANVLAFIWERMLIGSSADPTRAARALVFDWGLVPAAFLEAPLQNVSSIFSSMFTHDPGNWMHIGGNMLFLWIFGDNVEDALGSVRYAVFYFAAGIAAAGAQIAIDPTSTMPMVGASGAIAGVLAAYGTLYPRSPVTILNPIPLLWFAFGLFFELPAWIVIAEFFVMNLWNAISSLGSRAGGVAFFAHVGGFVAGLVLVQLMMLGRERRQHERWRGWRPPQRRAAPRMRDPYSRDPYGDRRRDPWGW